ncbi:MAG: hypothetical protein GOVbin7759_12 [Prokaryotic dsDNA virus sp.]|jgi:hypothetical protein|nr:MAG: hypothetical protein GOVbin7759_12 [Prokaryotic dsDNA virus sp.]
MMADRCRWHTDGDLRFLVPGCWNRAVHGDDATCHCPRASTEELESRIAALETRLATGDTNVR